MIKEDFLISTIQMVIQDQKDIWTEIGTIFYKSFQTLTSFCEDIWTWNNEESRRDSQ